jgi:hypothetical protein
MNFQLEQLPNNGIVYAYFSDEELEPILKEVSGIMNNNFINGKRINNTLVGNIKNEFALIEAKEYLNKLLLPLCLEHNMAFKHTFTINNLKQDFSIVLESAWINFQQKYEFNPVHCHRGIYSFVIWLKIPFLISEEKLMPHSKDSNGTPPGSFEFLYTDILGKIRTHKIEADMNYKNYAVIFPSELHHCVYPFFTSDEYRISISGNFSLNVY